jgi:hypothetical protein
MLAQLIIPAMGRLRQEDREFQDLGYMVRYCP